MLGSKGFDLWANGYDRSVGLSDESNEYPFAGYRSVLGGIFRSVMEKGGKRVLDIGFGTGTLAAKLYENGCTVFGQDFSERMISIAREKMPDALLYCGDFSCGLVTELAGNSYDHIIATYSLHHLTDEAKIGFIRSLLPLLSKGGMLHIGDVAFETREKLEACRESVGDEWDDEEIYFVFDEMKRHFPEMDFEPVSFCAGILTIRK